MAKRFTDTDKWKKPFVRGLKAPYKLLWFYILDDCDHAGIWHVDIDVANIRIGDNISVEDAVTVFGENITSFDNGDKWFIPDFIEFQYGELKVNNRVHLSVIDRLKKYGLYKPLISPLQGVKDKDKDKDKDKSKDKDKETSIKIPTQEAFLAYATSQADNVGLPLDLVKTRLKYNSWVANGWKTGGDKPRDIKNWKSTVNNTLPYLVAEVKKVKQNPPF